MLQEFGFLNGDITLKDAAESAIYDHEQLFRFAEQILMYPDVLARHTGFAVEACEDISGAVRVAEDAHGGQYRKGTSIPYIVHPLSVAALLLFQRDGVTANMVMAGLLHDTVEDSDLTIEEIAEYFSPEVAAIVAGCSEPDRNRSWRERKEHTISYLRTAPWEIKIVSGADKLHNAMSIAYDYEFEGDNLWSRFKEGQEMQSWYYRELAAIYATDDVANTWISQELRSVVQSVFPASAVGFADRGI